MYFKLKSNVMFREYDSFGYITDNRNFGYVEENGNVVGDKIVSQSGAVFLSALDRNPQRIESISKKIIKIYNDVDVNTIIHDAIEFYNSLEVSGFTVSGNTYQECCEKDEGFSYKRLKAERDNVSCVNINNYNKSTQDFFEEYFKGEPQLTNLHIEITSKCNERCVHCYIPHDNKVNSMDSNMLFNILDQCRDMNVLNITISGGEPMLHNSFIDVLKKCNEYNFSVNLLSNLTLLDDEILEEMKRNQLLSVQVSLYSMDAKVHDSITQVEGSYVKTKNAILKLIENNIPLQVSCPILKQNINNYSDVINWGEKQNINIGSDYVIIASYNHEKENLNNRLNIEDIESIIRNKIDTDPNYTKSARLEAKEKENLGPDDFVCSVCSSTICINEVGIAYPCAGWQDYNLGDLSESSLISIWNNSKKANYLRNLRKRDFPKCLECDANDFCTMCMVRNANESNKGNPLEVNEFFCNISKMNKRLIEYTGI